MKICIDVQSVISNPTGVGKYTKELVGGFAGISIPKDVDITLSYFNFLGKFSGIEGFNNKAIRLIPGRTYSTLWKKFHFPPFNWFQGDYDVYHFPNFCLPPMSNGNKAKFIVTIHDLAFVRYPEYIEKKNLQFLKAELPQSLKRADRIITVSYFSKKELMELFDVAEEKISVVYEGVSERFWQKNLAIKNTLSLPDKYILCVSTLEPRKNITGLIEAYKLSKLKDYKLVIAGGKGWFYESIFKAVEDLGLKDDVVFTGYVRDEDLPGLYKGAKLFVFPSFYEGFGLPPLEAMASGVPVVSTKFEALGDAACFIDPNNPEDIAVGMREALKNPLELIEKGCKWSEGFTWKKTAKETLKIYQDVNNS